MEQQSSPVNIPKPSDFSPVTIYHACQLKHSYDSCGLLSICDDCDLPVCTEQDLIIPVVDEPAQPNQQVEVFEPLQPLNFDALQIVLDQFVHWFLACPYSRSTNEKKRVFDEAVPSISNEFNLTPPQSKNYFWGVQQRLELLP